MKKILSLNLWLFLLSSGLFYAFVQDDKPDPWKPEQIIKPADLAKILNDPKSKKPFIVNVGPMALVKGAVGIGTYPASTPEGLEKFKAEVAKQAKTRTIVIYCGCCTMKNCPNIRPAWEHLLKSGYTKSKLLDIPTDIQKDWIDKGYPMNPVAK